MKTIIALLLVTVASAFSQSSLESQMRMNEQTARINNQKLNERLDEMQDAANGQNVPISQMTDTAALMRIASNAPVRGKNAALGADIRRQVSARLKELAAGTSAGNERSNPGQLKYGESKLPPKTQAAPADQLMLLDASTGRLVPYNDLNVATLVAADAKLSPEQFKASVERTEAAVVAAYPAAKIDGHPINIKAEEIFAALEKINSPLSKISTGSWTVYQQAAQQLGIVAKRR